MAERSLRIALVEPFYAGSHASWANGLKANSKHQIDLYTLPGRHWKWRMHGGAINLADAYLNGKEADVILATDMLDLTTFLALIQKREKVPPVVLYMHENQLTYPWSETDEDTTLKRDNHYSFINLTSALAADEVWFNSHYHRDSFLSAIPEFLQQFPDPRPEEAQAKIESKSKVHYLGLELPKPASREPNERPLILWNHRWEYDKNPESFFKVLMQLSAEGVVFDLAVLGERYRRYPSVFDEAKEKLATHIVQWGSVESGATYQNWLQKADVLPVTSRQDFFGISAVEAIAAGAYPLLPDRLAFPEHLPDARRAECLYRDDEELAEKLKHVLVNGRQDNSELANYVQRYHWQQMITAYDQGLESLAFVRQS